LVVASRFPLSIHGSVIMAETLYKYLLVKDTSIEEAFLRARRELATDGKQLDWAGLQLYARPADGEQTYLFPRCNQPIGGAAPLVPEAGDSSDDGEERVTVISEQPKNYPALDELSLVDMLELQARLAHTLSFRFEQKAALVWVDVTGSTMTFVQLGVGVGHSQQEVCRMHLTVAAKEQHGRIIHASGDGTCAYFSTVKAAIKALFQFREAVVEHNSTVSRQRQLVIRAGLHYGPVFSDGDLVTGQAVDVVARIAETAGPGEMLISEGAIARTSLGLQTLSATKGRLVDVNIVPQTLYELPWRHERDNPVAVIIEHTRQEVLLPKQDIISFGRLSVHNDGSVANDIVLRHPDRTVHLAISRCHFELRRTLDGYNIHVLSNQATVIDGRIAAKGTVEPLKAPVNVTIADCVTLRFIAAHEEADPDAMTTRPRRMETWGTTTPWDTVRDHPLTGGDQSGDYDRVVQFLKRREPTSLRGKHQRPASQKPSSKGYGNDD